METLPLPVDWIWLALFALIPILITWGIYAVRTEMRRATHLKGTPIRLKTTDAQRRQWRINKQCPRRIWWTCWMTLMPF